MNAKNEMNNFDKISSSILKEIEEFKRDYPNITVVGEPGRLIC
jgi:hypothetical protein